MPPGALVVQVAVMGAEKPAMAVVRRVAVLALPAMTVPEVGVSATEKSTPLPLRAAEVVPAVMVPERGPVVVGLKTMPTVQDAAAASVPQVDEAILKSPVMENTGVDRS